MLSRKRWTLWVLVNTSYIMEYKLRERVNYICSNWYITILNYLSEFKFKVACLICNCKLYENYSKWEKKIMELRFHKLEFTKYKIFESSCNNTYIQLYKITQMQMIFLKNIRIFEYIHLIIQTNISWKLMINIQIM